MPKTSKAVLLPDVRVDHPQIQKVLTDLSHVIEELHRQIYSDLIGLAVWVDRTAARAATTIYQNDSGGRRWLSIVVKGATTGQLVSYVEIESVTPPTLRVAQQAVRVNSAANEHEATFAILLPKDWYYRLILTTGTLVKWFEYDD